jgi:hypothetical protein
MAPDRAEEPPVAVPSRLRRIGLAIAGPLVIVASSFWPARAFVNTVPQQGDIPFLWLPSYCFLGRTLRAGSVALWDPYTLAGTPFAADPQPMGWLYALPMALFSGLECGPAMAVMILLQPILGGLGLYWFLRQERLSRPAATVGGLILAVVVSGSGLLNALPIAAALAWTALLLAAASWFLNAVTWPSRLLRLLLLAVVFGQLLVAHFSVGGPMGGAALAVLFLARAWRDRREGVGLGRSAAIAALAVAALLVVNLAVLVPRLGMASRSNQGVGYLALSELGDELADLPRVKPPIGPTAGSAWPLELATSSGAYAGVLALSFVFAGWWSRRLRSLVAAFSALGFLAFVLPTAALARSFPASGDLSPPLQFYLHQPARLGYHFVLAVAVLAALGLQAWLEAPSWARRAAMLAPGLVLWGVVPVVLEAEADELALGWVVLGVAAAMVLAVALVRRRAAPAWLGATLAAVVAVDVVLASSTGIGGTRELFGPPASLGPRNETNILTSDILETGPLVRAMRAGGPGRVVTETDVRALGWGRARARLFEIESVSGYSSVQLLRFWTYLRAAQGIRVHYNRAYLTRPTRAAVNLLQIGWIVKLGESPPYARGPVATEEAWGLFRVKDVAPRASVVTRWTVAEDEDAALARVTARGFDPDAEVVLEADPGIRPTATEGGAARAEFRWTDTDDAVVDVVAPGPAIVLVRNVYDAGWRAEVDGRPAPVLAADYVAQGIPVGPGRHTIRLTYQDPATWSGLIGSGVAAALIVAAAAALSVLGRRRVPVAGAAAVPSEETGESEA